MLDSTDVADGGGASAPNRTWTFERTRREAAAVGAALCAADATSRATPSVRAVALFGRRSPRSYVALLAAWLAPCRALTVAPLSPWATAAELQRLLAIARPTTLALTSLSAAQALALRTLQEDAPEVLSSISAVVELAPDIPADILLGHRRLRPQPAVAVASLSPTAAREDSVEPALVDAAGGRVDDDGEAIALLLFTSGSTASPKPVMVPHRQLRYGSDTLLRDGIGNRAASGAQPKPPPPPGRCDSARNSGGGVDQCDTLASDEVVAAAVSLHWDVASYDFGLALTLPAALLVLPENAFDRPVELRMAMAEHGATVLFGTPSTLERVLLLPPASDSSRTASASASASASGAEAAGVTAGSLQGLRYAISTGEPFSAMLASRCRARLPQLVVVDCYGATEFSNVVSRVLPPAAASGQVQWGGLAYDSAVMSLRNPTKEAVRSGGGTTGELVLSTDGLMRGYLTAEMQQPPPPPQQPQEEEEAEKDDEEGVTRLPPPCASMRLGTLCTCETLVPRRRREAERQRRLMWSAEQTDRCMSTGCGSTSTHLRRCSRNRMWWRRRSACCGKTERGSTLL